MKRLLVLTLLALVALGCSRENSHVAVSAKDSSMTFTAATQVELDAANQRVNEYRQELLRQGFREVSGSSSTTSGAAISNSTEKFVLAGEYGKLTDLRVTLWTTKWLEKDQPQVGGGVQASIADNQADRDFEALYKKVSFVVTGNNQ